MENFIGVTKGLEEKEMEARKFARAIGNAVQEPLIILEENFQVLFANNNFYSTFKLTEENVESQIIFDLQKDTTFNLRELLQDFIEGPNEYQIGNPFEIDSIEEFILKISQVKGRSDENLIFVSFKRTSPSIKPKKRVKQTLQSFRNILAHAPAMICTLRGPEHIFEIANENYFQLVGNRDIIGKSVREAIPEVESQGFFELLDEVYKSGKPFVGNELPIQLDVGEKELKNSFLNFVYQPTFDAKGNVDGIFAHVVDVTEQVLARKKVEESEQQVRSLIKSAPFPIAVYEGKDMKITFANQAIKNVWGKGDNIIGKLYSEILPELSNQEIFDQLANVYSTGIAFHAENQQLELVIDREAKLFYFNYSFTPLFDSSGKVYGVMNTAADVTDLNIAKKKVEESENRYQEMIHSSPSSIATFKGDDYTIEIANDAILEAWGRSKEVIGKPLLSALPELVEQGFEEILQEVYKTGKPFKAYEMPVNLLRNGKMELIYFNFIYYPQRDINGDIVGVVDIATEVTPQAELNKKIKESESHFRQMANLMPDKVTNTDAAGNSVYFNQNWVEFTGLSREDLIEGGWIRFIHPQEKEKFMSSWQRSLDTGGDFEMELRLLNKSGKYKWHLSRAEAVKEESGNIKMWIGTNTEIQKIKEEEKRKEDFLKMVSHELKTPITSMKGYVQLLLNLLQSREDSSSMPIKPSLERINHQINRLTRLISEMLDLTRIEENKLELRKETFSLNKLIDETVQDITYTNTQHQIEIEQSYRCNVFADKDRIGQVLINFITNAVKYSPNNQRIQVRVYKNNEGKVAVSVKDKGIGIEGKNHKKIFRRFYRIGGKSEETYSGFGIGLYLANEIILRHNGTINLESKVGEGSNFTFTLSVASEDPEN